MESKLEGKTLAELEREEETEDWVRKFREKQEALPEYRKGPGLEAIKSEKPTRPDYTAEQMKGLKVSHNIEEFKEGEDRILTLKDNLVLDDQADELIDIELTQAKKLAKTLGDKKRRPGYVAYDDDEFLEKPGKRPILSHYDEVLEETEGQKKEEEGFVLSDPSLPRQPIKNRIKQHVSDQLKDQMISLEQRDRREMSNYYSPEELLKFRKVTKRASLKRRDIEIRDGELNQTTPIVESSSMHPEVETYQSSSRGGHDEDELQTALEQARLLTKRKKERVNSSQFAKLGKY